MKTSREKERNKKRKTKRLKIAQGKKLRLGVVQPTRAPIQKKQCKKKKVNQRKEETDRVGIERLFPALAAAGQPCSLSELSGKRIAVDMYVLPKKRCRYAQKMRQAERGRAKGRSDGQKEHVVGSNSC